MSRVHLHGGWQCAAALLLALCLIFASCDDGGGSDEPFTEYDLEMQQIYEEVRTDESMDSYARRVKLADETKRVGGQAVTAYLDEKYGEEYNHFAHSSGHVTFKTTTFPLESNEAVYSYNYDQKRFIFKDNYARWIIGQDIANMLEELLTECYGEYHISANATCSVFPQELTWGNTWQDLVDQSGWSSPSAGVRVYVKDLPGADNEENILRLQQELLDREIETVIYVYFIVPGHWDKMGTPAHKGNWYSKYAYLNVKKDKEGAYYGTDIEWTVNRHVVEVE